MTHDKRGHYGIAMLHPSHAENVAGVARATGCFDADYMATIGTNYEHHPASVGHERHTPIWQFDRFGTLCESMPHDTEIVAVDFNDNATPLSEFQHPERAMYVLGEEGPGFQQYPGVLNDADETVYMEAEYCMNVAVAGNMVLRDRYNSD
jgi:tRNA(Leu) C34 or U34 (ribose-2'-O)-methylase TrmL